MKYLSSFTVKKYRNINKAELAGLGDLNIMIGPNNIGKTNLLELIKRVNSYDGSAGISCNDCKDIIDGDLTPFGFPTEQERDSYRRDHRVPMKITIEYNEGFIRNISPQEQEELEELFDTNDHLSSDLKLEFNSSPGGSLPIEHLSKLSTSEILDELNSLTTLQISDQRLKSYENETFTTYIQEKDFRPEELTRIINHLGEIVDENISSISTQSLDVILENDEGELSETIKDQGSGVRSIVCAIVDIIDGSPDILLFDEPELGLNPKARRKFLSVLMEEAQSSQIFLVTHDPVFVNPVLWDEDIEVSVYLYSYYTGSFTQIDLNQNSNDPNVFAGYLPHTTSLKETHFYVEGASDVNIFNQLLRTYFKSEGGERWWVDYNRVGIFHLAGSNWKHLLHTIPGEPYRTIVLLDGDKREESPTPEEVVSDANTLIRDLSFEYVSELSDLSASIEDRTQCPIYCLERKEIEEYLPEDPDNKDEAVSLSGSMTANDIDKELITIFESLTSP